MEICANDLRACEKTNERAPVPIFVCGRDSVGRGSIDGHHRSE
jgi:hypothetical protein